MMQAMNAPSYTPIMNGTSLHASAALPDALNRAMEGASGAQKATEMWQCCKTYSPYLTRLAERHPELFIACTHSEFDTNFARICGHMIALSTLASRTDWMKQARTLKEQAALCISLADISGTWQLTQVTQALSLFAEHAVKSALEWLLLDATRKSEWKHGRETTMQDSSAISILGMGKLGAYELNYSSDIDIIVLFDPKRSPCSSSKGTQHFMNRLVQQLVFMLQERTEHGYVLRTDIRLRPDPMSTPPAVSIGAALHYYETVGQNWERAAMIKARHIAGDNQTSEEFLRELIPYIWRKNLDFNAINDINSIMRQMYTAKDVPNSLLGQNIKTGIGGIRSIEFFVQTQQLVWGGRNPSLRENATIAALHALHGAALIDSATRDLLADAYGYLRTLEHRLQMIEDAQTHSLPTNRDELSVIANFMGFNDSEAFEAKTREILKTVQTIYAQAMQGSEPLSADGNLVFTGVDHDPETLRTLTEMGYTETVRISAIIQGWHRGNRRSTRSKRSRQLLTELLPTLLSKLSESANPDSAFFQFDDFLERLPSGVQIFSLIQARPEILGFISHILGSAAALGHTLSANPLLLDAMMEPEFFMPLIGKQALAEECSIRISAAQDFEQVMILLRVFQHEKHFQAGAHMLKGLASPARVAPFLSDLAEVMLQASLDAVFKEYAKDDVSGYDLPMAVLGLGKLGARDLTFNSDLDLVFIYDDSSSENPDIRKHMHRISQRFIHAITSMTREGRLYEVDTRLRPGGASGPIAISLSGFDNYFQHEAWIFEHMALTKARVVASHGLAISNSLQEVIHRNICRPRDKVTVLHDMQAMREKVAQEFGTTNPWHIKYVRGGMMDLEFTLQCFLLLHAQRYPTLHSTNMLDMLAIARDSRLISEKVYTDLTRAYDVLATCLSYQRLCIPGGVIHEDAPHGVFLMMANALQLASPAHLKDTLQQAQQTVLAAMNRLLATCTI